MFAQARRHDMVDGEALLHPGVGDYTLRAERSATMNPRPSTAPFGAASLRPPLSLRPAGEPNIYLDHAPPTATGVIKFASGERWKDEKHETPSVGTYDLTRVTMEAPRPILSRTRPATAGAASSPTHRLPPSIPGRDTAGYAVRGGGGGAGAGAGAVGSVEEVRYPPDPSALALLDLRDVPKGRPSGAVPFSHAQRWVPGDPNAVPGVGRYDLLGLYPATTKVGVSFSSAKLEAGSSMGRPTTAPHVGPGSYDLTDFPDPNAALLAAAALRAAGGVARATWSASKRDPLDMDKIASMRLPGPGDHNLQGDDLARKAKLAREADARFKSIGTVRARSASARAARPGTTKMFGGTTSNAFRARNGVAPLPGGIDRPPPLPKVVPGVAIPAFGTTALRKEFGAGADGPGPADYSSARAPPTFREEMLRAARANTGFSTSRRFVPSERDLQLLENPEASRYWPNYPDPNSGSRAFGEGYGVTGGGRARSPPPSSPPRAAATRANAQDEGGAGGGEEEPLGEWNFTSDFRIPILKPSFNKRAAKGLLPLGAGQRSDMVGRDKVNWPGPGSGDLRQPTAKRSFNTLALSGMMMAPNAVRPELVSRDLLEGPGPQDYSPKLP
jgi:hypothetical protein